MKVIMKLISKNSKIDIICRTRADFEKLEGIICIESNMGIKEIFEIDSLKERGYEYIIVILDDIEYINEPL